MNVPTVGPITLTPDDVRGLACAVCAGRVKQTAPTSGGQREGSTGED